MIIESIEKDRLCVLLEKEEYKYWAEIWTEIERNCKEQGFR